jgi:hypothetical protein
MFKINQFRKNKLCYLIFRKMYFFFYVFFIISCSTYRSNEKNDFEIQRESIKIIQNDIHKIRESQEKLLRINYNNKDKRYKHGQLKKKKNIEKGDLSDTETTFDKGYEKILKSKDLLGRVEWIFVGGESIAMKSRVDTGAKTSSLHGTDIKEELIGETLHVKFKTVDQKGVSVDLIRPVLAKQNVKNTSGKTYRRYVIRENVRIGNKTFVVNVNLNNRTKLSYKFLIGRNILMSRYVVDVSKTFIQGDIEFKGNNKK